MKNLLALFLILSLNAYGQKDSTINIKKYHRIGKGPSFEHKEAGHWKWILKDEGVIDDEYRLDKSGNFLSIERDSLTKNITRIEISKSINKDVRGKYMAFDFTADTLNSMAIFKPVLQGYDSNYYAYLTYYKNGMVESESTYLIKDENYQNDITYYPDHKIKSTRIRTDTNQIDISYYENGFIESSKYYWVEKYNQSEDSFPGKQVLLFTDANRHGDWLFYDKTGKLKKKEVYSDGKLIKKEEY